VGKHTMAGVHVVGKHTMAGVHVVGKHTMVGVHGGTKLLVSWQLGSERERGRGWGPNIPFKDMPPITVFRHLVVPAPPIAPWAGDQVFNTWTFGGHSRSKL
jgi:hypothetical protein